MALLLETVWGDLVIDFDVEGSPHLCKNLLKLAKARYFTKCLIYDVSPAGFCRIGCPLGNGRGGASIYAYIENESEAETSNKRFLRSQGRRPPHLYKGDVIAVETLGVPDAIGSQFAIVLADDNRLPEGSISLGKVAEDEGNVLQKIASAYCDPEGRPYADIRIIRALVVEDPFDDPTGLNELMARRGIQVDESARVTASPSPTRPPREIVPVRIQADEIDDDDEEKLKERQEEALRKEDRGRAVVLEMLGDLPDADIKAPENVLFICKLNPITQDEDLELILSRFDPQVKVEIIRDHDSGQSLQYAFAEFTEKPQAVEAYFKMNNALVDDRRIKVDFSQSVSKIWDKYNQRMRMPAGGPGGTFGADRFNRGAPTKPDNRHDYGFDRKREDRHDIRGHGARDEFGREIKGRRSRSPRDVDRKGERTRRSTELGGLHRDQDFEHHHRQHTPERSHKHTGEHTGEEYHQRASHKKHRDNENMERDMESYSDDSRARKRRRKEKKRSRDEDRTHRKRRGKSDDDSNSQRHRKKKHKRDSKKRRRRTERSRSPAGDDRSKPSRRSVSRSRS